MKTGVSRSIWMGAVAVVWLGASGPSHAHHGFASHFDPFSEAQIEGTVTGYEFINPHVLIHVQVTAPDGEAEPWVVESAGVTTFYREGDCRVIRSAPATSCGSGVILRATG